MIKYKKIEFENMVYQFTQNHENHFFRVPVSFTIVLEFSVKYINSSNN